MTLHARQAEKKKQELEAELLAAIDQEFGDVLAWPGDRVRIQVFALAFLKSKGFKAMPDIDVSIEDGELVVRAYHWPNEKRS